MSWGFGADDVLNLLRDDCITKSGDVSWTGVLKKLKEETTVSDLFNGLSTGDQKEALQRLIARHDPLCKHLALRYRAGYLPAEIDDAMDLYEITQDDIQKLERAALRSVLCFVQANVRAWCATLPSISSRRASSTDAVKIVLHG